MNSIIFDQPIVDWENNSDLIVEWSNNSSQLVAWGSSAPTNNIRYADFIRITTTGAEYRFTTAPSDQTVAAVDPLAFSAVGVLIKVGEAQRDIKSTANETTVTLTGIDTAMLGFVLGQNVKGAKIEMWHGFYNTNGELITGGGTGGLYQFFNGYISSFSISEQWMEELRMYVGTITVSASAIQLILQNRTAGRYTNNNSWQFFNSGDTSMNRVNFIQTINYQFGKGARANS
jgi:hypothetical protein